MRASTILWEAGLIVLIGITGCGGGGDAAPTEPAPSGNPGPPGAGKPGSDGRYVGIVTIDDLAYFADAMVTIDGEVRLYVGGPGSDNGAMPTDKPAGSLQFVGEVTSTQSGVSGSGIVIGETCAAPPGERFCRPGVTGDITLTVAEERISGELRVTTSEGAETWRLDLAAWSNYYELEASETWLSGQYRELLAAFASDGDTLVTIDYGELFFQSSGSGCTGNGLLTPHLDGSRNVYDVSLSIGNCSDRLAHLNGEFEGLATTGPSGYWDYDDNLRVWVSTRAGTSNQAAITMWAAYQY
jgi:hypothetical protein